MKKFAIYKCPVCGNVIELEYVGGGPLSCCGKPMILQEAGTTDGATEKHIPFIQKKDNGYLIRIGEVEHPMVETHYIEWIEIIAGDRIYKKFLKPGDKPEVFFDNINEEHFLVREYCNIHGLWEIEY